MNETLEAPAAFTPRPPRSELFERGRALRPSCPRSSHAIWNPPADRPDPVRLVVEANAGRLRELIPLRHGRMSKTPFTFYRGTALNMATDLANTPTTGERVQACGDAHLGNFRCFATPERRVIFDIHDLDETLLAPWEWDIKRLAASVVLVSRENRHSEEQARDATLACVRSYREAMARYSEMRAIEVWYDSYEADDLIANIGDAKARAQARKRVEKERGRCPVEHDFPLLADDTGDRPRIKDDPPEIYHDLVTGSEEFYALVGNALAAYRESLADERRVLLDRYAVKDLAIKVVGVGSVGTLCSIALFMAGERDPLFLQIKEARRSVLEPFAGTSAYLNQGQRVVKGHRLMQSASDVFLGWTRSEGRDFYIRQLRDVKVKFNVERFEPVKMMIFAEWCGATLARAHARSGEPAVIAGYLGKADTFDKAIAAFAAVYADQAERDHERFLAAIRQGEIEAHIG